MRLISKQVEKLKDEAEWSDMIENKDLARLLRDAADTIETLSAKVRANNLYGGWVSADDELPNENETYIVAWVEKHHDCPYPHYYGMLTWNTELNDWLDFDKLKPLHKDDEIKILAWMPLPHAYEGVYDEEST